MVTFKKFLLVLVVGGLQLFFQCNSSSPLYAGGSTSTEVSVVSGLIVNPNGTPAVDAIVNLRPADYLTDSSLSSSYRGSHSIISTRTSSDGSFNIDSILQGFYHIEVSIGDTLSILLEVNVESGNREYKLPDTMLMPMAEIVVNVQISSSDSSRGQMQIFGMEREVCADSLGNFKVWVPQGAHTIHLDAVSSAHSGQKPPEIDGMDIRLNMGAGEKRNIGTFNLAPQPLQPCLDGNCDSITINNILDTLGMGTLPLDSFCTSQNGRIVSLSFRGRQLAFIPRDITKLMKVTVLNLGKTGLQSLFHDIKVMRNLTSIYLDSNNLSELPVDFGELVNCSRLDLSGNNLSSLPNSIVNLSPHTFLDLTGNNLCGIESPILSWANTYDPDWKVSQRCP